MIVAAIAVTVLMAALLGYGYAMCRYFQLRPRRKPPTK